MFKSLHHVPVGDMDGALREIRRVLRPGAWPTFPSRSSPVSSTRWCACSATSGRSARPPCAPATPTSPSRPSVSAS
ncbi:class I SAM-dependent methyltransferase [Azorhizophilus paspali]|uniref:Class I SAM-dependent methyltransferase n=1 Tax=Azorhizophilus paspali TaxID=69963 RepID=A0ABV6SG29_AZOPA